MAFTDEQRTKRYELETKQGKLSPAERILLAALNDLKEANDSGKDIKLCEEAVKQAEKALANEGKEKIKKDKDPDEIVAGGDDVKRIQLSEDSKK